MRKIREICGPFNHHGHVVADIRQAMEDYLAIGIGPFFFGTHDREKRWDEQVAKDEKGFKRHLCFGLFRECILSRGTVGLLAEALSQLTAHVACGGVT